MRVSTIGDRSGLAFGIRSGTLELAKWVAVALMLFEHWFRYVAGSMPPIAYELGRLVFPLFVFAFAVGLSDAPWSKSRTVLFRLLAWGIVAQIGIQFADPAGRELNVLFTFGLGLLSHYAVACAGSWWRASAITALALLASLVVHFGPIGVLFVFAFLQLARARFSSIAGAVAVALSWFALAAPNGSHAALGALPVLAALMASRLEVPRVPGFFYWIYAGQFFAFVVLQQVLA